MQDTDIRQTCCEVSHIATQSFSDPPIPVTSANRALAAQLGYECLGPVIMRYLMLLDSHVRYCVRTGSTVLFVSRAGVRIRRLYEAYLAARGTHPPKQCDFLFTSRCLSAKAAWPQCPAEAMSVMLQEFRTDTVRSACLALLQCADIASPAGTDEPVELSQPAAQLPRFLLTGHALARALTAHLRDQALLFATYLRQLLDGSRRVALVDTGWQGTTQRLLASAFPQYDWCGLYFGKVPSSTHQAAAVRATALVFDAGSFVPGEPATAFALYRHLLEGLFQPRGKSINHLEAKADARVWAPDSATLTGEQPTPESDPIFCAVETYLREVAPRSTLTQTEVQGAEAMSRLARILAFPARAEALALGGLLSSLDFGRAVSVPALIAGQDPAQREARIQRSLWPQGQIALEYEAGPCARRQQAQLGLATTGTELFQRTPPRMVSPRPCSDSAAASVAVVVPASADATGVRSALLSVGQQTYRDYVCVVTCCSSQLAAVKSACATGGIDPRRLLIVAEQDRASSRVPANTGVSCIQSEFVVVHDTRGNWRPEFLERALAFLRAPSGAPYAGVVAALDEAPQDAARRATSPVSSTRPFAPGSLAQVHTGCRELIPAIAFVFRRGVFDALGGYDDGLPALADWEFGLRVMRTASVGRLRDRLAILDHDLHDADLGGVRGPVFSAAESSMEAARVATAVQRSLYPALLQWHFSAAQISASFSRHPLRRP